MAEAQLESLLASAIGSQELSPEESHEAKARMEALCQKGEVSIEDVIRAMAEPLTSTRDEERAKAAALLSQILSSLKDVRLPEKTLESLAQFFADRLSDWPSVKGALRGALILLERDAAVGTISRQSKVILIIGVLNVHVQALPQADRMIVVQLLQWLLAHDKWSLEGKWGDLVVMQLLQRLLEHEKGSLEGKWGDLVSEVIAAIDGEKDPRCLLLSFRIVELLAQALEGVENTESVQGAVEELFDVISCYFPISFVPAPNDPRKITRAHLSAALLRALTASPLFAPHCIRLFLEKLGSSYRVAKLDSLEGLGHVAAAYGPAALVPFVEDIWQGLKPELLPFRSAPAAAAAATGDGEEEGGGGKGDSTAVVEGMQEVSDAAAKCLLTCERALYPRKQLVDLILNDKPIKDLFVLLKHPRRAQASPLAASGAEGVPDTDPDPLAGGRKPSGKGRGEEGAAAGGAGVEGVSTLGGGGEKKEVWERVARRRVKSKAHMLAVLAEVSVPTSQSVLATIVPALVDILLPSAPLRPAPGDVQGVGAREGEEEEKERLVSAVLSLEVLGIVLEGARQAAVANCTAAATAPATPATAATTPATATAGASPAATAPADATVSPKASALQAPQTPQDEEQPTSGKTTSTTEPQPEALLLDPVWVEDILSILGWALGAPGFFQAPSGRTPAVSGLWQPGEQVAAAAVEVLRCLASFPTAYRPLSTPQNHSAVLLLTHLVLSQRPATGAPQAPPTPPLGIPSPDASHVGGGSQNDARGAQEEGPDTVPVLRGKGEGSLSWLATEALASVSVAESWGVPGVDRRERRRESNGAVSSGRGDRGTGSVGATSPEEELHPGAGGARGHHGERGGSAVVSTCLPVLLGVVRGAAQAAEQRADAGAGAVRADASVGAEVSGGSAEVSGGSGSGEGGSSSDVGGIDMGRVEAALGALGRVSSCLPAARAVAVPAVAAETTDLFAKSALDPAAEPLLLVLLKALSSDLFAPPKSSIHHHHQHHHQKQQQQKQQQQKQKQGGPLVQGKGQHGGALVQEQEEQLSAAAKDSALGLWHAVAELSKQGLHDRLAKPLVSATAAAVRSAVQSCGRSDQEAILSLIVPTHLHVTAHAASTAAPESRGQGRSPDNSTSSLAPGHSGSSTGGSKGIESASISTNGLHGSSGISDVSAGPSGSSSSSSLWTQGLLTSAAPLRANVPLGLLTSAALVALRPGAVMAHEERLLWRLCSMACAPGVDESVAEAAAMAAASVLNKWPKEGKPLPLPLPLPLPEALTEEGAPPLPLTTEAPTEGRPLPLPLPLSSSEVPSEGGGVLRTVPPTPPGASEAQGGSKAWSLEEVVELVVDRRILPCILHGLPQGAPAAPGPAPDATGAAADASGEGADASRAGGDVTGAGAGVSGAGGDISGAGADANRAGADVGGEGVEGEAGERVTSRVRAVQALSWVLRGLAMRGHPRAEEVAQIMLALLLAGSDAGTQHRDTQGRAGAHWEASAADSTRDTDKGSEKESDKGSGKGSDSGVVERSDKGSGEGGDKGVDLERVERSASAMPGEVAAAAARGLGVLMDESEWCLNAACHAVTRPLFKQRMLTLLVPRVFAQAFHCVPGSIARANTLRGLAHLLRGAPPGAVLLAAGELLPLILDACKQLATTEQDAPLLRSLVLVLSTFLTDEGEARELCEDHATSVVTALLNLLTHPYSASVRETAVECLTACAEFDESSVHRLRSRVLKALKPALDDRRRAVRVAAVSCSLVWSSM